jgi:undecaprenyl pyrophosphate phosphatase UppP
MEYFTARNAVILALLQAGAIVAGVLGAGAAHKWYTQFNAIPPDATVRACSYGFVALLIPMIWAAVALAVLRHRDEEASTHVGVFLLGVLLFFLLLMGAYTAAVHPLLRLLCGCGGLSG